MDQIHISFALENPALSLSGGSGASAMHFSNQSDAVDGENGVMWVERMIISNFFLRRTFFGFDMVHPRTFLETYRNQPAVLRYAVCALAGKTSIPPAPIAMVRAYFEKALHLVFKDFEACTAEYLKLHIDPSLSDDSRANAPWEVKETLRRMWWSLYFTDRVLSSLLLLPGLISLRTLSTASVLPPCEHTIFISLNPNHAPSVTAPAPPPLPSSPRHGLNILAAISVDIVQTVPARDFHAVASEDLEARRAEAIEIEGRVKRLLDDMVEGVAGKIGVSARFLAWAFAEQNGGERDVEEPETEAERISYPPNWGSRTTVGSARTRIARDDSWDHLFLYIFSHSQLLVLQRPWLARHVGSDAQHLPPIGSLARRYLLAAKEKTEASVAAIVGSVEKIFWAVDGVLGEREGNGASARLIEDESPMGGWAEDFLSLGQMLNAFDDQGNCDTLSRTHHLHLILSIFSTSLKTPQSSRSTLAEVDTPMFLSHVLAAVTMAIAELAYVQDLLLREPPIAVGASEWHAGETVMETEDFVSAATEMSRRYLAYCEVGMAHLRRLQRSFAKFWYVKDSHLKTADMMLKRLMAQVEGEALVLGRRS
ncbi:hypothetical protein HDU96_008351 [Phlyctochytrium bullatum]|nr:hypothetical protein HDU96_008351 [Phlyctochytrium bullatum]